MAARPSGRLRELNEATYGRLARLAHAHPWWILGLCLLLAIAAVIYTGRSLRIETSRLALLSPETPYNRLFLEHREEFEKLDDLVIAVRTPDPRAGIAFVDELYERLSAEQTYLARVLHRVDPGPLEEKAFLFLSMEELDELEADLTRHEDFLTELAERPGLNHLFAQIDRRMSGAVVSHLLSEILAPPEEDEEEVDLSLLAALLGELRAALEPRYRFHSPWTALGPGGSEAEAEGYLTNAEETMFFVLAQPVRRPGDLVFGERVMAAVRGHLAELEALHPGVEAGATGMFAMATDEMVASRRDTVAATGVAAAGVLLVFLSFFSRRPLRPVFALIALSFAITWTLGFATLTIGHLTVLSVAFAAILLGLGIDFGIHFIARFEEEDRPGRDLLGRLTATFVGVGPSILAGALTTAAAFFAVTLTDFRGLNEVGIIAGTGVLLALIAAFTALPALLVLDARRRSRADVSRRRRPFASAGQRLRGAAGIVDRSPGWIIAGFGVLTVAIALAIPRLGFDYNLLNLQAEGTESVVWEQRLLAESDRSTWYAAATATSLPEVRAKTEAFEALPAVRQVESIIDLVPEDQPAKQARLAALAPLADRLPRVASELEPVELRALRRSLASIRGKLGKRGAGDDEASRVALEASREHATALVRALRERPEEELRPRLERFQELLFQDLREDVELLRARVRPAAVTMADIPREIRDRWVGRTGRYQLLVYAEENIWEHDAMERFITQLRSVDPQVTGGPVQTYEAGLAMRRGYEEGGLYALTVILLVLAATFRAPRPVALALVPLLFAALWTVGLMGLSGVQFNLANMILLPLLVGVGIDAGIHLVKRHTVEGERGSSLLVTSTARAVLASTLTSMVGFGSLMVAAHRGIFSIGLVLVMGLGALIPAAFILLPAITSLGRRRGGGA